MARLVIALGQARTAPLAVRDFLLVNHEANKTDKKEGRESD